MAKMIDSITELAWHRNGISGKGFYAIRFKAKIEGSRKKLNWLACVTDDEGECYVICLDLIETCGVKFAGGNSWRGDHYEPELREAIATHQSSGSARVGPFAIPT